VNNLYQIKQYQGNKDIKVTVPGSKSITNRALLLAALSAKRCLLKGVLFSDDSLAMLDCLSKLGFDLHIDEEQKEVTITGCGGKIPNKKAHINVRSAGTAARFLTVVLALCDGEYTIDSSEQMKKRPMEPLISILRKLGANIECLEKEGHFPLRVSKFTSPKNLSFLSVTVDTELSSQFASALLIAGVAVKPGLFVTLSGSRTEGAYIRITLKMMEEFGINYKKVVKTDNESQEITHNNEKIYSVSYNDQFGISEYQIEPDVSSACYFYAMSLLLKTNVLVRNIFPGSIQGDMNFLYLLEKMGAKMSESAEGICLNGKETEHYYGVDVDMQNFSDQVMTLAALSVFAETKTIIRNVSHIRRQESDRLKATLTELKRIGVSCEFIENESGILIRPLKSLVSDYDIETYEDHRMAMAFTLIGLKTGKIKIKNPDCCAKTFVDFFDIIDSLSDGLV